jgi:hypothetical protein
MSQQPVEPPGRAALKELDPIQVEVLWNRLISIVEEQATVLIRTAFYQHYFRRRRPLGGYF